MDFTIKTYRQLLDALLAQDYVFQPFVDFLEKPATRAIILRHDVEARYKNALAFARLQHESGICGTYYFRLLPNQYDETVIREIAALGHEIGYHYDDLSSCKGDHEKAILRFEENLATLREIAPVKTICMEGAPLSRWDNRDLWGTVGGRRPVPRRNDEGSAVSGRWSAVGGRRPVPRRNDEGSAVGSQNPESGIRNYRDYGIIGEPYFDIDFSKVLYLTDTGRRWDGVGSIRDKVNSEFRIPDSETQNSELKTQNSELKTQNSELKTQNFTFRHTKDIIDNAHLLPDQLMLTFHPQRWNDRPGPWLKELVLQNVKNVAKSILLRLRA